MLDDVEDCNDVCKVFLGVPMGVDGHVEDGFSWKLDLQNLRFFLGDYKIHHRYVLDGWPIAQLPFLAFRILQLVGMRVVLILACCQSPVLSTSLLRGDFGGTCRNPAT